MAVTNIIKFRVVGEPHGKAHTGFQKKGSQTAKSLCRGVELRIAEVVLDCSEHDECSICLMKRQNITGEFGSVKAWAERQGMEIGDNLA
jgi:hypothetical protein